MKMTTSMIICEPAKFDATFDAMNDPDESAEFENCKAAISICSPLHFFIVESQKHWIPVDTVVLTLVYGVAQDDRLL